MQDILLNDVMNPHPISIQIDRHFSQVEEYLRKYHIRHLPVVNANNVLQGIITQRDLYRLVMPRRTEEGDFIYLKEDLDNIILEFAMSKDPLVLGPNDSLAEAIKLMVSTKYGCIPIVNEEFKLIGVITQIDVLKFIFHHYILNDEEPKKQ